MPRSVKEHSSGTSQPQSNPTLGHAASSFLADLPQEERSVNSLDLNSFVRWFGSHKQMDSIQAPDLERYQEQIKSEGRRDTDQKLQSLRAFFAEAKKQGWISTNLAVEIKVKRTIKKKGAAGLGKKGSHNYSVGNGGPRLTQEGYDKLSKELEYLETEMRPQISLELKTAAADKDFRENAPYDVAKNHQGEVEARIRELKRVLETGEVVGAPTSQEVADLGSKVTLFDMMEDEEIVYTLVGPGEIDPRHGKISIQSPVGKALTGAAVGNEVEVAVPAGTLRLKVQKIENR